MEYTICYKINARGYDTVEADSLEEAYNKVIYHRTSQNIRNEEWISVHPIYVEENLPTAARKEFD